MTWARVLQLLPLAALSTYVVRFHVGPLPTTILEVILLAALVSWTVESVGAGELHLRLRNFWRTPFGPPAALWLVAGIPAIAAAPDHVSALGHFRALVLEPVLYAVVLLDLLGDVRIRPRFLALLAVSPLVLAAVNIVVVTVAITQGRPDVAVNPPVAIETSANAIGLLLGPVLAMAAAQVLFGASRRARWAWGAVAALWLLAIALSYSRGSWLGTLAVAVVLGTALARPWRWFFLGGFAGVAGLSTLVPHVLERIRAEFDLGGGHSSVVNRAALWRSTLAMLRHRPVTGAGLAGFKTVVDRYRDPAYHESLIYPHNLFLTAWSEMGLLGLLAFPWLLGAWLLASWRAVRDPLADPACRALALGLLGALAYIVVHGLVDVPYWKNDLAVEFWALLALAAAIRPGADSRREAT